MVDGKSTGVCCLIALALVCCSPHKIFNLFYSQSDTFARRKRRYSTV
jgi:hypothetical protein